MIVIITVYFRDALVYNYELTMEAWKSLDNLPESVKARLLQVLLSSAKEASVDQDETGQVCSSQKSNLDHLIENFSRVCSGNSPENNPQVGESRKRQKTLDGWVIKRNSSSSSKSKVGQSSNQNITESDVIVHSDVSENFPATKSKVGLSTSQNIVESDIRTDSDNVSETNSYLEHNALEDANSGNFINSVPVESETVTRNTRLVDKSTVKKDVSVKSIVTVSSKDGNEKYNLRPKRKASHLSPIAEDDNRDSKHFKSTNNQCDYTCITDYDENAGNIHTDIDGRSHRQFVEEIDLCITDNLIEKKNSYNRRTKKKNTKLQQPIEINNLTIQGKSDNQVKARLININEPSLNVTSPPQSNYEAFCKLGKICSSAGLNITDILQDKKIQIILNDHKNLYNDAVVFIGSLKSNMGKMLPIVHLAHSKKKLLENLSELQKNK